MLARKLAAFLLSLIVAAPAVAMFPENGWYWNKNESGRGFNIEIQDNLLFMSAFMYDVAGKQVWYTSAGRMTSDRDYTGVLYLTLNGQCLGCPYAGPPGYVNAGQVTIKFTTASTADIVMSGVPIKVERHQWGIDFTSTAQPLLGEWAITHEDPDRPGYYGGETLTFDTVKWSAAAGMNAAYGYRGSDKSRVAAGAYVSSAGRWEIENDYSPTHLRGYSFVFVGFDRIQGEVVQVAKNPPNPRVTFKFVGHRTKSATAVQGGNAPGLSLVDTP